MTFIQNTFGPYLIGILIKFRQINYHIRTNMMEKESFEITKIDWSRYFDHTINITMSENYGVVYGTKKDEQPTFYEIVFKTGKLIDAFAEGLLLEAVREGHIIKIFVPFKSIKCVEIY